MVASLNSPSVCVRALSKELPYMVFSPTLGGTNGGFLNMRMQVILDSLFTRLVSILISGARVEKKVQGLDYAVPWLGLEPGPLRHSPSGC